MALTVTIADLYIERALVEYVRGGPLGNYIQVTVDYSLLDENHKPLVRRAVARYGPNSGLPAEQLIDPYLAAALEEIILRTGVFYKVQEGLLPAEALKEKIEGTLPDGIVYRHEQ